MKIVQLKAENYKRLKAVEITPDGNMVVISGRNEQGKSSVLDSIFAAIGGKAGAEGVPQPIREGEETAQVQVDLGDIVVTRKWTAKGSYLTVENQDGASYKSPQSLLDGLVGKISFDPLAFAKMNSKAQKETLQGLVDLGIDLDAWAKERQTVYNERTNVNRMANELQGALAEAGEFPEDTPDDEISSQTVLEEMGLAQCTIDQNKYTRDSLNKNIDERIEIEAGIERTNAKIQELEEKLLATKQALEALLSDKEGIDAEIASWQEAVDQIVDPDLSIFKDKLAQLEGINANVRAKKQKAEFQQKWEGYRQSSETLTQKIDALDQQKQQALENAEFPIADLSFDEDGVLYKNLPFSQASGAETLRVSLSIAMAMNPKLRVIRIQDANDLDSTNWNLISEMAKDNDFQIWAEIVDESGKLGVVIEDGEVVESE